ncbi:hypothetical protein CEUSTIGMA_g8659.t1 [Chlamydomonas eustigma]|uniref:Chlorophyll a-b binding protein, chloroplastic n=1 Tax=Chlamydomonas eustigma TaxID=1157962 RepID=A0A250XDR2_9CHLO|nr:hypothetical protein CEUSTIGMA_g8659.t1 [Chlamydomonas eustigma]|eukprot:GAX81227.1 hypothetical protein CEUSTIGMA_g8659.t1 [Chlamydomonas eustigma]
MAASSVALRSSKISLTKPSSCKRSVRVSANRTLWLPDVTPPAHLKGTLPGDFGFDPLGLGQDPERLKWLVEGEKTNARWAMAAVAGILGQELLTETKWWEAGAKDYDLPVIAQVPILFATLGFLETKRLKGWKETGTSGFINSFPFDPAGMNTPDMAVKEIKNGRLAMIAFVGFAVQALATRTQPIEGLTKHISDPLGKNITWYLTHLPEVLNGTA